MKTDSLVVAEGKKPALTPRNHSRLMKAMLNEFASYFAPNSRLIYVRETNEIGYHFDQAEFESVGVSTTIESELPDAVIHHSEKNRLFLIDAITGHGPIDPQRRRELAALFEGSTAGLVYVTAFLRRSDMAKYVSEISWETEVWVEESPSHLIHFDGKRFLGPYAG